MPCDAPDLPWAGTKDQIDVINQRCGVTSDARMFDDTICVPSELAGVHFEKGFGSPGALKSSEYVLLAGPMGKYLLEGCLHSEQEAAVFQYLDLLGIFWEKTISEEQLQHLEKQVPVALAELELVLPAWELDMNRHLVTHLVRQYGAMALSGFGAA